MQTNSLETRLVSRKASSSRISLAAPSAAPPWRTNYSSSALTREHANWTASAREQRAVSSRHHWQTIDPRQLWAACLPDAEVCFRTRRAELDQRSRRTDRTSAPRRSRFWISDFQMASLSCRRRRSLISAGRLICRAFRCSACLRSLTKISTSQTSIFCTRVAALFYSAHFSLTETSSRRSRVRRLASALRCPASRYS